MNLIIAGGGTGGHVFPGIAIAQALQEIAPAAKVTFIGTKGRIEERVVPQAGFDLVTLNMSGIKGKSVITKIKALWQLSANIVFCIGYFRKHKIDTVLGVGGYASAPAVCAGILLRLPTYICEQNSIPGFTNRVLGRFVKNVFGSFDITQNYFSPKRFVLTGNPLRKEFWHAERVQPKQQASSILVMGGSLGARIFNEVIPKAAGLLKTRGFELKFTHQCGKEDQAMVQAAYAKGGALATVLPFIDDVVSAYQNHDILISRAGATTCAEVTALGVVAIMVPYPWAIYDHQTMNAQQLVKEGAARMVANADLTPENLANQLETLLGSDELRRSIADAAVRLGRRDAAQAIANSIALSSKIDT